MEEMYMTTRSTVQRMYQIDSQTLKEMISIAETLREHIKWFLQRMTSRWWTDCFRR